MNAFEEWRIKINTEGEGGGMFFGIGGVSYLGKNKNWEGIVVRGEKKRDKGSLDCF